MAGATVIHQLASLLKETGDGQILKGSSHLALTGTTLKLVTDAIERIERKVPEDRDASANGSASQTTLSREVVFLRDFFLRVPAVKLNKLPDHLNSVVDLSLFKSLETLSMKRIPVSHVVGLSGVREQCKKLSCQNCLVDIKDLLLSCGADNTGPLSWSSLVDLDLSYNGIPELNESLKLCLSIQTLDLSHNQLVSDETGLQHLPHLCALNLAYNKLESVPKFNQHACLCLTRLILRNNNLTVLVGIEHLKHLQDVDLSYNCLISHSHLSPLQQLNQLTKLFLNNNPLAFHSYHRCMTAARLSPHINPGAIYLDGKRLSDVEKQYLPKPDGYGLPSPTADSSYLTAGGSSPTRLRSHPTKSPLKVTPKSKGKGKSSVRPVSIHEDDIDQVQKGDETTVRSRLVFDDEHTASLKREEAEMLRKQVGDGWLVSYQEKNRKIESVGTNNHASAGETTADASTLQTNSKEPEVDAMKQPLTVHTLHDDDEEDVETDSVYKEIFNVCVEESDDESLPGHHVETSRFVCITDRFVVEKDHAGKEIGRLDRTCLHDATVVDTRGSQIPDGEQGDIDGERPVVQLEFNHARRDRRRRRYILENNKRSQALLDILQESINMNTAIRSIQPKYECLKCSTVFERRRGDNSDVSSLPSCPHCNSDHVVDRGSASNGPSPGQRRHSVIPECVTPLPFIELIRQSTPIMFDARATPIVGETAHQQPMDITSHTAGTVEQQASSSTDGSFKDLDKSCSSAYLDESQECVPLHIIGNPEWPFASPSVSVTRSRVDGDISLSKRDATASPIRHQRSLSQPWNGLMIDRLMGDQSRSRSEEDVGVEVGSIPEQHTTSRRAASSWSDSVREAYERQSSRAGSHSRSASRAVSQESLLDENSTEIMHRQTSGQDEANLATSAHQIRNSSTVSSGSLWLGIDPNNCTTIHHQLRLYYDLQLFKEDDEQFDSHYKCDVVICNKANEQPGLVVLSSHRCFFCTCKDLPPSCDDWSWIKVHCSHTFCVLHLVTVGLGKQFVRLEFGSSSHGAYSLLFRDALRTSVFISRLAACTRTDVPLAEIHPWTLYNLRVQALGCGDQESLKEMARDMKSVLSDSTDLIQDRRGRDRVSTYRRSVVGSELVSWLCANKMAPDRPKACALVQQLMESGVICHVDSQSAFEDNASLFSFSDELGSRNDPFNFFILCHRITESEESQHTVAFMATTNRVYLLQQNFHQPEPVETGPLLEQFSNPQFATIASEEITDISQLIIYKSHPLRLSLGFFESDDKNQVWHLQLETGVAMEVVTAALSGLWKEMFKVELKPTEQS